MTDEDQKRLAGARKVFGGEGPAPLGDMWIYGQWLLSLVSSGERDTARLDYCIKIGYVPLYMPSFLQSENRRDHIDRAMQHEQTSSKSSVATPVQPPLSGE